ncbi:MAG: hypothetical protein CMA63_05920 [Euryarchaeota archaeon]|nr:hypothetical protein [Euryarchaeota archaeon]
MYSRRVRIFILGGIITIGLLGVLLMEAPDPTRQIDEVMDDPSRYVDQEIAIRGEVLDGSIDESNFEFILHGTTHTLRIDYADASVSNGLGDNRTVYAQGVLKFVDGEYVLHSDVIKTSCPSKYEEATE